MTPDACDDADWPFRLDPRDVDYLPLSLAEQNKLTARELVGAGMGRWDTDSARAVIDDLIERGLVEATESYEGCSLTASGKSYFRELDAIARAEHEMFGNPPADDWQCTASSISCRVMEIIDCYGFVSPILYARHVRHTRVPRESDVDKFLKYWNGSYHEGMEAILTLVFRGDLERVGLHIEEKGDEVIVHNDFGPHRYQLRDGITRIEREVRRGHALI